MKKIFSIIFLLCAATALFAQGKIDWGKTAVTDLSFAYQMYRDNHAGGVDPETPCFNAQLEKEYKKALKKAAKAKTEYDYQKALVSFLAPFKDGHMRVEFDNQVYPYNFKPVVDESLRRPLSWESFGGNNAWLYLHTFLGVTLLDDYKKFLPEIENLKNKDIIVLDVRYNGGGNSGLGYMILNPLYGQDFVSKAEEKLFKNSSNWYRATPWVVDVLKRWPVSYGIPVNHDMINKVEQAMEDGKPLAKIWSWPPDAKVSPDAQTDLKAKIYVLTDEHCFSACLSFLDILKAIGDIVQVGRETNADTRYAQVDKADLPSGKGKIVLSYQLVMGRLRKNNESYKPDYKYKGDMNDTAALQKWILQLADKK